MKLVRLTKHAVERCGLRGATEEEVREAVENGSQEPAQNNKILCRLNFPFNKEWEGEMYPIKQVAPVIKEEETEIVVITVYTYYF